MTAEFKWYKYKFGEAGNLAAIPDDTQGGGLFAVVTSTTGSESVVELYMLTSENATTVAVDITSVCSTNEWVFDAALTVVSSLPAGTAVAGRDMRIYSNLAIENVPTSASGLPSGVIWSNGGVLNIVP